MNVINLESRRFHEKTRLQEPGRAGEDGIGKVEGNEGQ